MKTVVIIGAGASGLACASSLSRLYKNMQILVLEQFNKSAKKLLATGNGRCNLSNKNITIDAYNTKDERIEQIIQNFDAVDYFNQIGLVTKYSNDLLYPFSNQAATVKKVLLDSLHKNVTIIENCKVLQILSKENSYVIKTTRQDYRADYVVCAIGSKAGRLSGEDNLQILEDLQLKLTNIYPSLVQLHTSPSYPMIKGVRVRAKVSLVSQNKVIETKEGEVLFTETGVSGICVMQLSRFVHRYADPIYIHIDMLPEYSEEEIKEMLRQRKSQYGSHYLEGIFNEKLAKVLMQNKIFPKQMMLEVVGTNDYIKAQVISGGLSLDEVNYNLECIRYPNLFVIGEALDVDGDCGGYNLHHAFASGEHVAKTIHSKVKENDTN